MLSTLVLSNENRLPASQEEAPASIKRGGRMSLYKSRIDQTVINHFVVQAAVFVVFIFDA